MSWTKRQFVEAAFEEIGISGYNFDVSPEMQQVALKRLDAMMASWNARGVRTSYPIPSNPTTSDLDENSTVPDSANEAIFKNLAIRIAPVFGRQISPDLKQAAQYAFNAMMSKLAEIPEMQFNQTIPAGQGNKWRRNYSPMLLRAEDQLNSEESGYFDLKP